MIPRLPLPGQRLLEHGVDSLAHLACDFLPSLTPASLTHITALSALALTLTRPPSWQGDGY